ncbi:MAG: A/G-specific adenine glycosylase [Desulfuromonadales bacterium]|nr:A/G-specific adenine glycosylase [Desulfuromonadales bacterium]
MTTRRRRGTARRAPTESFPFDPTEVAPRLLAWYGAHGRDLPWRHTRDPYCIWLSEIMLQQTTVAAVIPYYQRFLATFPEVATLAVAPPERVIELWAGLGYYSRARNLHRAAQKVVEEHGGDFPKTVEALAALPGVGRSTAGAIVAIAFDRPAPILDGNVRRVLVRLFAYDGDPRGTLAERALWKWAEALTARERAHDYAQAIMDLGATVCTPRDPGCPDCPLAALCQARRQGLERQLPVARIRKSVPVRRQVALLVEREGFYLVRPRPHEGFLGGLWEFPVADVRADETPLTVAGRLAQELGFSGQKLAVGRLKHAYSHFTLELDLVRIMGRYEERVAEGDWQWQAPGMLVKMPLHGAHRKALERFVLVAASGAVDE